MVFLFGVCHLEPILEAFWRPLKPRCGSSDLSCGIPRNAQAVLVIHWIGFVGKIYRKPWFLPSNIGLSCKFSHNPILWVMTWNGYGIWNGYGTRNGHG